MRPAFLAIPFITAMFFATAAPAQETIGTGVIKTYECGDNCYLTITTDKGEDLTALCAADACGAWNEQAEMPAEMVGRKVEVSLTVGKQYDGNGTEMGEFPSFSQIKFGGSDTAGQTTAMGVIKYYECGDNCYLTITTDKGEDLTGLCATDECASWNEMATMPDEMIGRKVEVLIGKGKQFDAEGNEMGDFPSFDKFIVSPL